MDYKKMWQELRGYVECEKLQNEEIYLDTQNPHFLDHNCVLDCVLEKMQSIEKEATDE